MLLKATTKDVIYLIGFNMNKKCIKCKTNITSKWYSGPLCRKCYRKNIYQYKGRPNSVKKCLTCDKHFEDNTYSQNAKYCCKKCYNVKVRNEYVRKKDIHKKCMNCKNIFTANINNKNFCGRKCYMKYYKSTVILSFSEKIKHRLRSRLSKAIHGNYRTGSAVRDLGCSIADLKKHLESKFKCGMSWDNYGQWHIDHVKPLSKFNLTDKKELKKACHYSNLQPLWAKDNLRKGSIDE